MEAGRVARPRRPRFPPIFIIGLPRTGSTLVYHALVRRFGLAYLCNAAASLPNSPVIATSFLCAFRRVSPGADFRNLYGVTPGWSGPAQGREVWGRWFPMDQSYCGPGSLSPEARLAMRSTVAGIESAFGMPFANKAQGHAVRLEALCETFEDAVFVRVNRDRLEVAESILRGRRDCFKRESRWFSAKPSNYEQLVPLDAFRQIAGQICGIEGDMQRAFGQIGAERVLDIDFREFCAFPSAVLDRVREFYERRTGTALTERHHVPPAFEPIQTVRVEPAETDLLRRALEAAGAGP